MSTVVSHESAPAASAPSPESVVRARLARTVNAVSDRDGNVFAANCVSRTLLDHVTSKWGVLVIVALSEDTLRWGELRRGIEGIGEKMLAQTLRLLEGDGFVQRDAQPSIPPRVDYSLTARGQELAAQLIPLVRWIGANA